MEIKSITLVSFGIFEKSLLKTIETDVRHAFNLPVKTMEGRAELGLFFNGERRQYDANQLLQTVNEQYTADYEKTCGLFTVDLFIPILTYIFGQAYLNGRAAIASNYRLSNERYALPVSPQLLAQRFSKEVIHELGHAFGLVHCHVSSCVMRSSTYVEDIDQKSSQFCKNCHSLLEK